MNVNTKVQVSKDTTFHAAGKVGYFQFNGEGPSQGLVILTDKPTKEGDRSGTYFVVEADAICPIDNDSEAST
jgi:hypothetical protein